MTGHHSVATVMGWAETTLALLLLDSKSCIKANPNSPTSS